MRIKRTSDDTNERYSDATKFVNAAGLYIRRRISKVFHAICANIYFVSVQVTTAPVWFNVIK